VGRGASAGRNFGDLRGEWIEPVELAHHLRRVLTVPSRAGATSCGCEATGTESSVTRSARAVAGLRQGVPLAR
jgi:hypothetical protein